MADDEPLQPEDLFTRLKPNRQRQNYHRTEKTEEDVAKHLNAEEERR
jgi:hypothetical protein